MVVIFSCSDVYIKLQVVADTRLDGGTEEQRHGGAETWSCNESRVRSGLELGLAGWANCYERGKDCAASNLSRYITHISLNQYQSHPQTRFRIIS